MSSLAEALAKIPTAAERLDAKDDQLRFVIRYVEDALNDIAPGIVTSFCFGDGRVLAFEPARQRWVITWRQGPMEAVPLLNAARRVRASVFEPMVAFHGLAPIERLIIEVSDNLTETTTERGPQLEVAKRLSSALQAAGYTTGG